MTKLLICALMLLAATAAGFAEKEKYSCRCRNLQDLIGGMHALKREIQTGDRIMSRILKEACARRRDMTINIFCSLSELMETEPQRVTVKWPGAMKEIQRNYAMQPGERDILIRWGCEAGKTSKAGQENLLNTVIADLEAQLRDAQVQRDTKGKMRQGMIIGITAAAAILLL